MKQLNTLKQAIKYFSDEDNAWKALVHLRWEDGTVKCPFCNHDQTWYLEKHRSWKCKSCRRNFSVRKGTALESSKVSIGDWMIAIWMFVNCKTGINSYQLERAIGAAQSTTWRLGHKIRAATLTETFKKLGGIVETDETFIGGKMKNKHYKDKKKIQGRGSVGKTPVVGSIERGGKVVASVTQDVTKKTLHEFVKKNVKKGAKLCTDAFPAYAGLGKDYAHKVVDHSHYEYVLDDGTHTNSIESFWGGLKRTLGGTYIQVSKKHLQKYVNETAFRFNHRHDTKEQRFLIILKGLLSSKKLTYDEITGKVETPCPKAKTTNPKKIPPKQNKHPTRNSRTSRRNS